MYEAKKIIFYDPFGGKREIVTEFFANIRYDKTFWVFCLILLLSEGIKIPKKTLIFVFGLCRSYLKAKADMEGWDASTVDTWKEEFLYNPRQPNNKSCGVYICMVNYIITV